MRILAGNDAFFVFEESPSQHMHTMKILIVDAQSSPRPVTYESVRSWAAERLPRIPPLRWRVMRIPLGLGRPVFVDAPDLDLGYHVQQATLRGLGDDAQLDELVSAIASTQLDHDKPLWQLWFVDGLAGGRVALVLKIHHAIADGGATVQILEEALGVLEPPDLRPPPRERPPSGLARIGLALRMQLTLLRQLPAQCAGTLAWIWRALRRRTARREAPPAPFAAPNTPFNRPLTPNRSYVNVTIAFADLRLVKDALGATLNDAFVALCSGALRRYLAEHGELPTESLTATSPVGVRGDASDRYGNAVSYWFISLASDVADPGERIAAVKASTSVARELAAEDRDLFARWQDHYSLYRLVASGLSRAERLAKRPDFNLTVSNMKGPRPLEFCGAPVVAVRSMGPIVRQQGLNITGWSYNEDFAIGLHACREHVPDLRRLADLITVELKAMIDATASAPLGR